MNSSQAQRNLIIIALIFAFPVIGYILHQQPVGGDIDSASRNVAADSKTTCDSDNPFDTDYDYGFRIESVDAESDYLVSGTESFKALVPKPLAETDNILPIRKSHGYIFERGWLTLVITKQDKACGRVDAKNRAELLQYFGSDFADDDFRKYIAYLSPDKPHKEVNPVSRSAILSQKEVQVGDYMYLVFAHDYLMSDGTHAALFVVATAKDNTAIIYFVGEDLTGIEAEYRKKISEDYSSIIADLIQLN